MLPSQAMRILLGAPVEFINILSKKEMGDGIILVAEFQIRNTDCSSGLCKSFPHMKAVGPAFF